VNEVINVYANSFQLCWSFNEGRPKGQTLPLTPWRCKRKWSYTSTHS